MKKAIFFCVFCIVFSLGICVDAADVVWDTENIKRGELRAEIVCPKEGEKIFLTAEKDRFVTKISAGEGYAAVRVTEGETVRAFVWDKNSLEPKGVITSVATNKGVKDENTVFADNQQSNRSKNAAGYRTVTPLDGEYIIKMRVTVLSKGDNAIMLGDSGNGVLGYASSSAILLFNGDNFAVRSGNGSGAYSQNAVNICSCEKGGTYDIAFWGNVRENTYKVIIEKDGERYISDIMTARKNGTKIDTIALVSNGRNTDENSGYYSNYAFVGQQMKIITDSEELERETLYEYDGFAGMYYGIKIGEKYLRGNNGRLSADYDKTADESAMFIPRDMGDGSYAFVCRSSKNRMTFKKDNITSSAYNSTNDSQHWILEKSENYSGNNLSYYIKNKESGKYVGKIDSDNNIVPVDEKDRTEVIFEPLYEKSPLYMVSKTRAYSLLDSAQMKRIESAYESVGGDVFGRYGGNGEWTLRIRLDNMFDEILSGNLTEAEQVNMLKSFLSKENGYIYANQASYVKISPSLPGTEGLYLKTDGGAEGTYDFWRGTKLAGVLYKVNIFTKEGEVQQTINLYVQNDGIAKANAETFKKAIVQIPYIFRRNLKNVKVRSDNANSYNGGGGDLYIRLNWSPNQDDMRSTVIHELGHIIDSNNGYWASGSGWANAVNADMYSVSTYGATNNTEDFAEFCRLYFSCYGTPDMQRGIKAVFPERYASFGRLRKNNMEGWGLWEDEYTS